GFSLCLPDSKNRKGIETRLSSGQPEESSLQRNSCRIHSRRRENKAMNPAENEPNVFRYTGNHFIGFCVPNCT
ncbi:hypothetical protein Tsp_11417, partial [Trichinella spiralis]|uniref:hypothetical protein n=1 Tax=Trichinella spiralis TaxID=6334 RepID=UPI0001EFE92D